jgi:ribosome-interacting GTPase 1
LVGLLRNADVLCVVLDLSTDLEFQEMVIEEEVASFGREVQSKPLPRVGTRAFDATDLAPSFEGQLSSNVLVLGKQDDCRDVLAKIVRLTGYKALLAKPPGQTAEEADRYWVDGDATVDGVAAAIHRGLAGRVEGARIWGGSVKQAGQMVSPDHVPQDEDVVELILR